ncbi:uncharacterized protein LOC129779627 [Toxorhynchites rutilus septentrionalis]|uniref:uncharacterized protein LOC129779627 n=1 Tax=Toxorhynchites rutilus septentrionalis TaxID=329112 RepID=UPI00247ADBB8|nr:uncharacterized protein LOC129779627 [Toxorhynchites rutilus septentrionalis]
MRAFFLPDRDLFTKDDDTVHREALWKTIAHHIEAVPVELRKALEERKFDRLIILGNLDEHAKSPVGCRSEDFPWLHGKTHPRINHPVFECGFKQSRWFPSFGGYNTEPENHEEAKAYAHYFCGKLDARLDGK